MDAKKRADHVHDEIVDLFFSMGLQSDDQTVNRQFFDAVHLIVWLAEELADVLEVLEALRSNSGISKEELARVQEEKRAKRGGFDQLVYLEETGIQSLRVAPGEKGIIPLFADDNPSIVRKSRQEVAQLRLESLADPLDIIRFTLPLVPPVTAADGAALEAKSSTMKLEVRYEGSLLTVSVSKLRPKDSPEQGTLFPDTLEEESDGEER